MMSYHDVQAAVSSETLLQTTTVILVIAAVISTAILFTQRLLFSPLSGIPGPPLAAISYLPEFYYDVILKGQFVFKIKEWHEIYGPIIRVNPREVHINDIHYLDNIYPISHLRKREKDFFQLRNLGIPYACAGSKDHDVHRRRRDALNPFFSQKAVVSLEPLIRSKVGQLCGYVDVSIKNGYATPLNYSDLFYGLARDIVFYYCFDKDANYLGNPPAAADLRRNLTDLLLNTKLNANMPGLVRLIHNLPPWLAKYTTPAGSRNMAELQASIRTEIKQIIQDREEKTHKRSILWDIRDHHELQTSAELPIRLGQEGTFLVMAGTQSMANSMAIAFYHIFANPNILASLRDELRVAGSDATIAQLERLPYLAGIINEANRLAFGLTGRNARVAPEETLIYGEHVIPPGTPVSMTTLCIHTNEEMFPDPWQFKPERWLGPAGKERQKYQYGLGRGSRQCVGMNLANAEMVMLLSAMAKYDVELFETDERDVTFLHDYHVGHPRLDSKGVRAVPKAAVS